MGIMKQRQPSTNKQPVWFSGASLCFSEYDAADVEKAIVSITATAAVEMGEIIVDKDKPDLTRIAAVNAAISIGKFASGIKNAIRGAQGVTLVFSPDMLIGFDHDNALEPSKQLPEPVEVSENMADYL